MASNGARVPSKSLSIEAFELYRLEDANSQRHIVNNGRFNPTIKKHPN